MKKIIFLLGTIFCIILGINVYLGRIDLKKAKKETDSKVFKNKKETIETKDTAIFNECSTNAKNIELECIKNDSENNIQIRHAEAGKNIKKMVDNIYSNTESSKELKGEIDQLSNQLNELLGDK